MRSLVVAALALLVVSTACTVESSNLTKGDASRVHLIPAICETQSRCVGAALFATVYPGGVEECKTKLYEKTTERDELTECNNSEHRQCADDFRAATCPTDPAARGLPPTPESCKRC